MKMSEKSMLSFSTTTIIKQNPISVKGKKYTYTIEC